MPYSKIHIFHEFNDFHRMANGGLTSHHDEIHVFRFEDVGKDASNQTPLFKTNFFQIGLFSQVEFQVSYFGKNQTVQKRNAVVLFKPGQTISFSKANPEASGYAIMFKENFIDLRLQNLSTIKDFSILNPDFNCVLFLEDELFTDLLDIARRMFQEYMELPHLKNTALLKIYSLLLIEKINRFSGVAQTDFKASEQYRTYQSFQNMVFQNIHRTKSVSDYAEMLHITEKTLMNHVRNAISISPKQFINEVLIKESIAMLNTSAKIDEIADYLNFSDQAHFSNFFRKMTGNSPRAFKKNL